MGAPRSGGRRHQGTDIFAPRGAKVFAIVDGVVDLRGYGSWRRLVAGLRGEDGTSYWYFHLQRYAIADGVLVSAGQLIAHNGDTGNAQGTPPHVHFEQHPGGGAATNPYPQLQACLRLTNRRDARPAVLEWRSKTVLGADGAHLVRFSARPPAAVPAGR